MLPIIQNPAGMASVYFGAGKLLILLEIMVDRFGQVLRLYCAFWADSEKLWGAVFNKKKLWRSNSLSRTFIFWRKPASYEIFFLGFFSGATHGFSHKDII
jgi:hypothetical protein